MTWNEKICQINNALLTIDATQIDLFYNSLVNAIENRFTIFTAGNGGLSNDHIAQDLSVDVFPKNSQRFIKCINLTSNIGSVTAIANDIAYEEVFAVQLQRFAQVWDVAILMSGSGNSKNIIRAAEVCKDMGLKLVGFTGFDGGKLLEMSDIKIHCVSDNMGICQDAFMSVYHFIHQKLQERFRNEKD